MKWFWIEDNDDYTVTDPMGMEDFLEQKEYALKSIARGNWAILFGLLATIASYINQKTAYMELTESNREIVLLLNNGSIYVFAIALLAAAFCAGFKMTGGFAFNLVIVPCIAFPLFPIVIGIGLAMIAIDFFLIMKVPVLFFFLVKRHAKKKLKEADENIEQLQNRK